MTIDNLPKLFSSPWGMAAGIVVLLLVWEGAKRWAPTLIEALARKARDALAGTRFMHGRALRTYRQKVASRYAHLPVLFIPDKGIDMSTVYVPLQAIDDGDNPPTEAYDRIKATRCLVVLGSPGSGKTMLLRHSMLTWAQDPSWSRSLRVPVLLELTRLCSDGRTLEEHIIAQFAEDGFVKADRFVRRALNFGKLSLLFDGLDEVSSADRGEVIQQLRTFASRYHQCQIVVTCRTAIYHGQLAPEIRSCCRVAEFDDRHIRRFLRQWPGMPDATAVERLLAALKDAPRIMQLARNPLLLTMIAYLYGGRSSVETVLPHSRAEFYHEATDVLLDRLKHVGNVFKGQAKKAVLMRLALAAQNTAATMADRRTLRYEDVLAEIRATAPRLNISESDADKLLDEIVDRSGLLLRVDGGARYQFAHLSLQEYLAAVVFEQDAAGLLAKYADDPEDWREVVKLWCGVVSTDSAPLVGTVFGIDEVLAFECLADAQVVDDTTADRITDHFRRRLLAGAASPAIISAFGLVAADPRPRGRKVFEFLTSAAKDHNDTAYLALAATKLPEAAQTLIGEIANPSARSALIGMGDLAVPALELADVGLPHVIDVLGAIATPGAALVLARAIHNANPRLARRAAWYLAASLSDPEVEAALCETDVPDGPNSHTWVWDPFRQQTGASLAKIAATIAQLCETSTDPDVPNSVARVDPRLAIPLLTLGFGARFQRDVQSWGLRTNPNLTALAEQSYSVQTEHNRDHVSSGPGIRLRRPARDEGNSTWVADVDVAVQERMASSDSRASLYRTLDVRLRVNLVARLTGSVVVRRQDWSRVHSTTQYRYWRSPQFWTAWAAYGLYVFIAVVGAATLTTTGWPWGPAVVGWVVAAFALSFLALVLSTQAVDDDTPFSLFALLSAYFMFLIVRGWVRRRSLTTEFDLVLLLVCSTVPTALPVLVGWHYFGWQAAIQLLLLVITVVAALNWYGVRRERAARNPLRGLLELGELVARDQTSIIAG